MKPISLIISAVINVINYLAGIYVAVTLIFRLDFASVFYVKGTTSNESLFLNLIFLQAGLALAGIVVSAMITEYKSPEEAIEFPIVFEIVPVIVSVVSIYYAFTGDTAREKILVIALSVVYAVLSAVIIYTGSRAFQIFSKK